MRVFEATSDEIPDLVKLLHVLFAQEEEFTPDAERQRSGLERIIEDPEKGAILALEIEGELAGMVNLLFTVSTFSGGRVAILEDMIVRPEHRGRGSGTLLLTSAIEKAKAIGCSRITLLTDATNEAAQAFYRRNGFRQSPMIPFRISL